MVQSLCAAITVMSIYPLSVICGPTISRGIFERSEHCGSADEVDYMTCNQWIGPRREISISLLGDVIFRYMDHMRL